MDNFEHWVSSTQLRRELTQILADLERAEEPIVILHHSRPVGVIWGHQRFQRLVERLEDAEDALMIHDRQDEPTVSLEDAIRTLEGDSLPTTV